MLRPTTFALDVVGTVVRLGLCAVWLVSGWIKVSDPGQTYLAVQAYDVLPAALVRPVAVGLPLLELVLAAFLLFGLATRITALLSGLVLLAFIAGVAQSWARGLSIDCGCFGGGGQVAANSTEYPLEIARDIGFLVLAGWLLVRPRSLVSVDGWLGIGGGSRSAAPEDDGQTVRDEQVSEPEGI